MDVYLSSVREARIYDFPLSLHYWGLHLLNNAHLDIDAHLFTYYWVGLRLGFLFRGVSKYVGVGITLADAVAYCVI